jgi:hypothetical protein
MLGHRQQYRILLIALVFALIMGTFYAAYQGTHHWDSTEARALTLQIKGGHSRPFSWEWVMGDPVAFFTLALAIATFALFCITVWMARATDRVANQNVKTLIATERPYLTGGGGFTRRAGSANAPRVFRVDVANYGKTPALLTHYDVQFTTRARALQMPLLEVNRTYRQFDWIAPASGKRLKQIPFDDNIDVIYGSFWYLDFNRIEHQFRFILSVDQITTYPDIADDVDSSYTRWT